jgi:serine/threonine-protein kinase
LTDLFLSYKAEDRARVAPLVEALEADGYSVWWDADIAGGDDWRETISRYLDAARCVIVVWSKKSVGPGGHFVRDEATRALRRGVYLPIRIDKIDPPLGFGETQVLNLQGWKGDRTDARYEAVLDTVKSRLNEERRLPEPSSAPRLKRRTVIVGAGTLTAAAASAGLWAMLRSRGEREMASPYCPSQTSAAIPTRLTFPMELPRNCEASCPASRG